MIACSALAFAASLSASSSPASATSTAVGTVHSATCRAPSGWRSTRAVPVAGSSTDFNLTSFDGTLIRIHWFPDPAANGRRLPTILMGPGWGQSGDTDIDQAAIQGVLSIQQLWQGGFNVITWDPRGFGKSGGTAEVDSPSFEGRDVSALINWVAQQPGVKLDRPGVPRIGMVGASYGGGIQFATASQDCRIDAIAPTIAWHSLVTSLDKSATPKAGWSNILESVSTSAHVDPETVTATKEMDATGRIDRSAVAFFKARGPAQYLSKVRVPTLILQGTVDDLFTLDEGIANYEALRAQGTTTAMAWFCGGHGVCLTDPGTTVDVSALSLAWMQHWVAQKASVPVLHGIAFVDQNGTGYAAASYPPPAGAPFVASGSGKLDLVAVGGSGPPTVAPNAQAANAVDAVAYAVTPGPATNAVDVSVTLGRHAVIVGAPKLTLTYSGSVTPGVRPTRVFAQLVDPASGIVVGNQVTPVPVILDGRSHTVTLPLETVAYTAKPGSTLELQLVATTVAYITPRLSGSIDFARIRVVLPTAKGLSILK
jgi:ABC-2 type transport system ATP-binding protein